MKAIPTLLTTTQEEFIQEMELFQKHFSRIQLDVADQSIVPNRTVQIQEMITSLDKGEVQCKPEVSFDFHLMVEDFVTQCDSIKKLAELGMNIGVILVNASLHPDLTALKNRYGFSFGLDIFPNVTIEDINSEFEIAGLPVIQIMTVNPGFQGSPFLPDMLTKIEQLRNANYKDTIMIDGGINDKTIPTISEKKYKPDFLCIGSYLTHAGEAFTSRLEKLNTL